jgi:mRNA interferase MazF
MPLDNATADARPVRLRVGDLVVLPFPFSDPAKAKPRPALVLTLPDHHGDFVALAVTSQGGHQAAVALDASSLAEGSLPKPSWVRADKLYTFHTSVVSKRVAQVRVTVLLATLALTCPAIGCTGATAHTAC